MPLVTSCFNHERNAVGAECFLAELEGTAFQGGRVRVAQGLLICRQRSWFVDMLMTLMRGDIIINNTCARTVRILEQQVTTVLELSLINGG